MAIESRLALTLSAHAWNADGSKVAVCPNNNEVWIYGGCKEADASKWTREHVLTGHDLLVSGIDWNPVTGRIVTVSYDRGAFVWTEDGAGGWTRDAVVLNIKFAATGVRWSPDGAKFAVSSSAKTVQVCFWDEDGPWWIPRPLSRKFKSAVLAVDWHPNGLLLATAGSDYRVRVFSAHLPEVDGEPAGVFGEGSEPAAFGRLVAEFDQPKTWVHALAWSPSGRFLSFVTQASEVYVADFASAATEGPALQDVRHKGLPHASCTFLSDKCLVCGGHDMTPAVYAPSADGLWRFVSSADGADGPAKSKSSDASFSAARAMFAAKTSKGREDSSSDSFKTRHKGAIREVRRVPTEARGPGGGAAAGGGGASSRPSTTFSTLGVDGKLIRWPIPALGKAELSAAALGLP